MHQSLLLKLNNVIFVPSFEHVGYNFNLKKKKKNSNAYMFRSLRKVQKWNKVYIYIYI